MEIISLRAAPVSLPEVSQDVNAFVTKHKRRLRSEAPDLLVQLNQLRGTMKTLEQAPAVAPKHEPKNKKHKKKKKKKKSKEETA